MSHVAWLGLQHWSEALHTVTREPSQMNIIQIKTSTFEEWVT